jgi:phosphate transport system permease protein
MSGTDLQDPTSATAVAAPPGSRAPARSARRRARSTARGEPMVWLTGGCVALAVLMIVVLLAFIFWQGIVTFWPGPLVMVRTRDGSTFLGEPTRQETYVAPGSSQPQGRVLYKTGNFDLTGSRFTWINDSDVAEKSEPRWALVIERVGWQNAYGALEGLTDGAVTINEPAQAWQRFRELHGPVLKITDRIKHVETEDMGDLNREQEDIRLKLHGIELKHGKESPEYLQAAKEVKARQEEIDRQYQTLRNETDSLWQQATTSRLIVRTTRGKLVPADRSKENEPLFVWQVVRAYPANQLGLGDKIKIYFSRWWEFLSTDPREANMEGGVFPAIVGTVLLTFIMVIVAVPLGVIAAIYLREYAKQGLIVSIVRISVNNLAGVPSIVFGVFGLGFFCYLVGGGIDRAFFAERLPDPTFGKSALIWASLTLALLTLPVVIVATEEALAAVPRSMREGSYACGASKWQTIRRIVLPRAMPGIMTGMILAIARGAGEVAPLMLVGAVKLAPELPFSLHPPFGLNRSFMHLGFHIYDLGFQSPDSEAARSMVYTTTLLLIAIVVTLNVLAMVLRSRLRRAYSSAKF